MDDNSFNGDNQRQINLIMSQSETAYFISTGMVRNSYEYKSCKVYLVIRLKKYTNIIPSSKNWGIIQFKISNKLISSDWGSLEI